MKSKCPNGNKAGIAFAKYGFYDDSNLSIRKNAQFIWFNKNFESFEDYISSFRARHRKNVKKERDKIKKQDLILETFSGENLSYDLLPRS